MKRKIMLIASLLGVSVFTPSCSDRAEYEPLAITCTKGTTDLCIKFWGDESVYTKEHILDLSFSLDKKTWKHQRINPFSSGKKIINDGPVPVFEIAKLSPNQTVYLKGDNPDGFSGSPHYYFSIAQKENDCEYKISGNIMSIIGRKKAPGEYTFHNLFSNSNVTDASDLVLPSNSYSEGAFAQMFEYCYKLTEAPKLPVTTLSTYCYVGMFSNCEALATAPELPATTLAIGCYASMFNSCDALKTVPKLPATNLKEACYYSMFHSCSNLRELKVAFGESNKWPNESCTEKWVDGVGSGGTFSWAGDEKVELVRSVNTVPNDWTIKHAD